VDIGLERVKGIEPSYSAWKAAALPLSYTRDVKDLRCPRDLFILILFSAVLKRPYRTLRDGRASLQVDGEHPSLNAAGQLATVEQIATLTGA
jgi:hypothetical protein